jgi:hypothetical protein
MARRPTPPKPQHAQLSPQKIETGIRRLEQAVSTVRAFDPNSVTSESAITKAQVLHASVDGALTQTFGHGTVEHERFSGAASFVWPLNLRGTPLFEIQASLKNCRETSLALLAEAISFLKQERELSAPDLSGVRFGDVNIEVGKVTFEPGLVFVIMPMKGHDMDDVYAAIKDQCERLQLRAVRVDESHGAPNLIDEIKSLIAKAEFIVCDLTNEKPNVYYELGYAHGLQNTGDDIILIAKEGSVLHFDIAPLKVNYYRSTESLRAILATNLKKMIEHSKQDG